MSGLKFKVLGCRFLVELGFKVLGLGLNVQGYKP